MMIRILSALFAALLLAGTAAPAIQPTDQGQPPAAAIAPAAEVPAAPAQEPAAPSQAEAAMTPAEAEAIALAHAGFTPQEVTRLHTEKDFENGIAEYDVEFRSGDWEYDYSIRIADGSIRKWDKEYDPVKTVPSTPAPAPTEPVSTAITKAQAQEIALAHAGVTAAQVKGLKAEKDLERGRWEFEVEFRVGNWEYEYDILAETGEILTWEKELDD